MDWSATENALDIFNIDFSYLALDDTILQCHLLGKLLPAVVLHGDGRSSGKLVIHVSTEELGAAEGGQIGARTPST